MRLVHACLVVALGLPQVASGQQSAVGLTRFPFLDAPASPGLTLAPLTFRSFLNTGWSHDRENGALWAGKGLSGLLRGGVTYARGPFRVTLAPEVTVTQNADFPTADTVRPGYSGFSAPWLVIDLPRRWGATSGARWFPGQSFAEVRWAGMALGATTANRVRGPEERYPITIGASAPGVPSGFVEAGRALGPLGSLKARAEWGVLTESPFFDLDPDNDRLLLSSFFLDWAPAFAPGLELGATVLYRDPLDGGFSPSMLWKAFSTVSAQEEDQREEDGLAAVHARWTLGPTAVWGTWGRSDYWLDTEDLITEPDHTQLYALGAKVSWTRTDGRWQLAGEVASTVGTRVRGASDYRHSRARTGHTNEGQMLGASIGPGARGAWITLQRYDATGMLGVELERILYDLDAYDRVLNRRDGGDGEDREWRLGALYEGPAPGFGDAPVGLRFNGGVSLRWNRDYIRYSSNAHRVGPRETNVFLDVALTWDPSR